MIKFFKTLFVVLLAYSLVVDSKNTSRAPTLVDKLVSNYFKTARHLWSLIENRTENVLTDVEKRLRNIELDGEDDIYLQIRIEDIHQKEYGGQISNIIRDVRNNYESTVRNVSEFNEKIIKARNYTTMLYDITSLDEFWDAALETATTSTLCNSYYKTAAQQFLLRYYYIIQLSYLRCFAMFQRLHMNAYIKFTSENIFYKTQARDLSDEFEKKFSNIRNVAKSRFKIASLEAFICKPYSHTKLTNFLQGFVDNEANLNPENSCSSQCSDYKQTKQFQCQSGSLCDTNEQNLPSLRCNGIIRDCYELDSSDVVLCLNKTIWYLGCLTSLPQFTSVVNCGNIPLHWQHSSELRPQLYYNRVRLRSIGNFVIQNMRPYKIKHDSTRRYNGIRVKNKTVAGRDIGSCQIKAISWLRGFYRCTNCYCLCDDNTISERHFSLRNVVSNIDENKVITSVRLNKVNGVIQFQIKERILIPYAVLDKRNEILTDNGWLSAPLFAVIDVNVTKDIDFYELSYDKRSINLDEIILPVGHILTGIRFAVKNEHLTIEVQGTPFDYVTGKLKGQEESAWFSNAKGYNEIKLAHLNSPDYSYSNYFKDEILKVENAYLKFGPTEYFADIGQTTIPYFDTTSVEPKDLVPLIGVGLYYKSTKYYSGYISPKLIVYDFEPHL